MARWGLPDFDLVYLWIDDPAELAALKVIDLVEDLAALVAMGLQQRSKVVDPVTNHEAGCARGKWLVIR